MDDAPGPLWAQRVHIDDGPQGEDGHTQQPDGGLQMPQVSWAERTCDEPVFLLGASTASRPMSSVAGHGLIVWQRVALSVPDVELSIADTAIVRPLCRVTTCDRSASEQMYGVECAYANPFQARARPLKNWFYGGLMGASWPVVRLSGLVSPRLHLIGSIGSYVLRSVRS